MVALPFCECSGVWKNSLATPLNGLYVYFADVGGRPCYEQFGTTSRNYLWYAEHTPEGVPMWLITPRYLGIGEIASRHPIARSRSRALTPWDIGQTHDWLGLGNLTEGDRVIQARVEQDLERSGEDGLPFSTWEVCTDGVMRGESYFVAEPNMTFMPSYHMVPELRVTVGSPFASPAQGVYRWAGIYNGRPHYRQVDEGDGAPLLRLFMPSGPRDDQRWVFAQVDASDEVSTVLVRSGRVGATAGPRNAQFLPWEVPRGFWEISRDIETVRGGNWIPDNDFRVGLRSPSIRVTGAGGLADPRPSPSPLYALADLPTEKLDGTAVNEGVVLLRTGEAGAAARDGGLSGGVDAYNNREYQYEVASLNGIYELAGETNGRCYYKQRFEDFYAGAPTVGPFILWYASERSMWVITSPEKFGDSRTVQARIVTRAWWPWEAASGGASSSSMLGAMPQYVLKTGMGTHEALAEAASGQWEVADGRGGFRVERRIQMSMEIDATWVDGFVIKSEQEEAVYPFLGSYRKAGVLSSRLFFVQNRDDGKTAYVVWYAEDRMQWVITGSTQLLVSSAVNARTGPECAWFPWEISSRWEVADGQGGFLNDPFLHIVSLTHDEEGGDEGGEGLYGYADEEGGGQTSPRHAIADELSPWGGGNPTFLTA